MAFTLQNSLNFAGPYIDYIPVTAGFGQEPAISIASMIRNTLLGPPMGWPFNRNEITFNTTTTNQDYAQSFAANGNDFGYVERVTLTDDQGNIHEIKDVYNNVALPKSAETGLPGGMSVLKIAGTGTATQTVTFRFSVIPNQIYAVSIIYQKLVPQFGPYFITSAANHSGANTTYTGIFDPYSLVVGDNAVITGFTNPNNNGTFPIVSVTPTSLVVANGSGVNETPVAGGFVSDYSWAPIPDQYSDIYNNLFISEILGLYDSADPRTVSHRQRGIAAFLSKAQGLSDLQKNWFLEQWLARGRQRQASAGTEDLSTKGRGV
jgi:hypothetical protein